MSEFNEGDLVEAVKGEESHRQRLVDKLEGLWFRALNMSVSEAQRSGWTFTVIEKAAPKALTDNTVIRRTDGVVYVSNGEDYFNVYGNVSPAIATKGGYKILAEPVPVTAKKVLDAIRGRIGSIDSAHDFQAVAAQFGVEA